MLRSDSPDDRAPSHAPTDGPADFEGPALRVRPESLRRHFAAAPEPTPIPNPHHEPRVTAEEARRARAAAVLIPVVDREAGPTLLLTRRHRDIPYGGHICFPGGGREAEDASPEATALRESAEEIALSASAVEIVGRLGDYVTHSGFRIAPIVGLVVPPLELRPQPGEVDAILEIPLDFAMHPASYNLRHHGGPESRAHFFLAYEEWVVSGPTVSLLMGLYAALRPSHAPQREPTPC